MTAQPTADAPVQAQPVEIWLRLIPECGARWNQTPVVRPRLARLLKFALRECGLRCDGVWPEGVLTGGPPDG